MRPTNGGLCTDTCMYVDEQSTFELDTAGNEAQVTIAGQHGDTSCLILAWGAVERLTPLFEQAAQHIPQQTTTSTSPDT
ncbi:hypothetical protein [Amycolatopsis cihanbeyliensis]|uniref:Uncharacterized protein n=1 Tax=Amycolatopsis cihanbeyliensis TaxID=1128664 RepID=A0A542CV06_AMYCI|nr:hypothetical protein [Amycolatopsis cihanbeyliensis]TQI94652.1 hypothetical protein FB471_6824 [Amycolatopsis cihanbeyliensis]